MNVSLFAIFISAFLVNNIILMKYLGLCPFFGVSTKIETAVGMSFAVLFVMTLATWITYPIFYYLLKHYDLIFLRTASFILVIATLVQLVEMFLKRFFKILYSALGIYLPLITTNCAILGTTFLAIDNKFSFLEATIFSVGTSFGFGLVIILFAALREKLDLAPISPSFKGYPIAFIVASLFALAFLGFAGLFGVTI